MRSRCDIWEHSPVVTARVAQGEAPVAITWPPPDGAPCLPGLATFALQDENPVLVIFTADMCRCRHVNSRYGYVPLWNINCHLIRETRLQQARPQWSAYQSNYKSSFTTPPPPSNIVRSFTPHTHTHTMKHTAELSNSYSLTSCQQNDF